MKINEVNRVQGIQKYEQYNKNREIGQKETKKDQIIISEEAKALLERTKEADANPKVDKIKEEISNGTYQVDSKMVAEKMIDWFNK